MAEPNAFDPTHALDGWRPPGPAPAQDLALDTLLPLGGTAATGSPLRLAEAVPDAFDPTHVLDGWRPPAGAPLDLELKSLAHAGRRGPDEAKKARLKARGYEMLDVEDIELTEAPAPRDVRVTGAEDVPPASPLAEIDAPEAEAIWPLFMAEAQVLGDGACARADTGGGESSQAQPVLGAESPWLDLQGEMAPSGNEPEPQQLVQDAQPRAAEEAPLIASQGPLPVAPGIAAPASVEPPVLDVNAFAPRATHDPRLVAGWQPQAWTALAYPVVGASTEVVQLTGELNVVSHAPQWLCALWPPQAAEPSLLRRWPEMAALIGGETRVDALQALLHELPAEMALWPTELEADWGLVAELVLQQDTGLRPAQARALREMIEAERGATMARLGTGYQTKGGVARLQP